LPTDAASADSTISRLNDSASAHTGLSAHTPQALSAHMHSSPKLPTRQALPYGHARLTQI
jgi:hypothetical protein